MNRQDLRLFGHWCQAKDRLANAAVTAGRLGDGNPGPLEGVGQDTGGKRRHVVRGGTQERHKRFHRQLEFCQRRYLIVHGAALPGTAVAFEASVGEINALAVDRIAGRLILCDRRAPPTGPYGNNDRDDGHDRQSHPEAFEGCCGLCHGHLLSAGPSPRRPARAARFSPSRSRALTPERDPSDR